MTLEDLVERAEALMRADGRALLGLVGSPGAGKSTLAATLVDALSEASVLVPMDGFHLANAELERLGRRRRKGAVDTFDADGYVALLRRLRHEQHATVYAPLFRRDLEEPIAGTIAVPPRASLVVTEGNYLLVGDGPWAPVRDLLDEVWFLECDDELRLERLVRRHQAFGKTAAEARAWAFGSDERNAELVRSTRGRADLIVRLDGPGTDR